MKLAYLAGPYSPSHGRSTEDNIKNADRVARKYWKKNYAVLAPQLNSARMDDVAPYDFFMTASLKMMGRCDIVIALANWRQSPGAVKEIETAITHGMEVIYDDGKD